MDPWFFLGKGLKTLYLGHPGFLLQYLLFWLPPMSEANNWISKVLRNPGYGYPGQSQSFCFQEFSWLKSIFFLVTGLRRLREPRYYSNMETPCSKSSRILLESIKCEFGPLQFCLTWLHTKQWPIRGVHCAPTAQMQGYYWPTDTLQQTGLSDCSQSSESGGPHKVSSIVYPGPAR